jgi:hypothetical protein
LRYYHKNNIVGEKREKIWAIRQNSFLLHKEGYILQFILLQGNNN